MTDSERIDELLGIVAHLEGEVERHVAAKNHTLMLLAACNKELDKQKKALARCKKSAAKQRAVKKPAASKRRARK